METVLTSTKYARETAVFPKIEGFAKNHFDAATSYIYPGAEQTPSFPQMQDLFSTQETDPDPDPEEETGEDAMDHLTLAAGQTSFFDRIVNLIEAGQTFQAVEIIGTALSESDESTIGRNARAALNAYELLDYYGYGEEARWLKDILSDHGIGLNTDEMVPDYVFDTAERAGRRASKRKPPCESVHFDR